MEAPTTLEFKDVRINVPWGHVAGRWYGNNLTRPILAIHGWLDNLGTWETLVPLLPQHIGVLCIDLPGHGLSSHLPRGMTYHVIDFVRIIVRIMEEYKWQKVSLMGHSLGSVIAFVFTSLFPHKVDLYIALDVIKPYRRTEDDLIKQFRMHSERLLIEDERLESASLKEPPSYTYDELERLLYEGSYNSVDLENCKYILNRSITKSAKYPNKYYFSRDGRLKNYVEFLATNEMTKEMAKKIANIPYLLVKASQSVYINEDTWEIVELLQKQNSQFEFHEVPGTHHVHLNNPKIVAALLNPFINHHRPARLVAWSMTEDVACNESDNESDNVTPKQPKMDTKLNSKL